MAGTSASTVPAPANGECYLLDKIPRDVRLIIYDLLWDNEQLDIELWYHYGGLTYICRSDYSDEELDGPDLNVLAVCKIIRTEALPILYSRMRFRFRWILEPGEPERIITSKIGNSAAFKHMHHLSMGLELNNCTPDPEDGYSAVPTDTRPPRWTLARSRQSLWESAMRHSSRRSMSRFKLSGPRSWRLIWSRRPSAAFVPTQGLNAAWNTIRVALNSAMIVRASTAWSLLSEGR